MMSLLYFQCLTWKQHNEQFQPYDDDEQRHMQKKILCVEVGWEISLDDFKSNLYGCVYTAGINAQFRFF